MVKKIVELCKARNMYLTDLERQSGLTTRTIYKWDTNRPSIDKVKAVADTLGVSIDEIVNDSSPDA